MIARLKAVSTVYAAARPTCRARRGAYNPTYLYYTYGKLEIQQLARDYTTTKGASLKQFHDAFVAQGSLPLPLVRRLLMR